MSIYVLPSSFVCAENMISVTVLQKELFGQIPRLKCELYLIRHVFDFSHFKFKTSLIFCKRIVNRFKGAGYLLDIQESRVFLRHYAADCMPSF